MQVICGTLRSVSLIHEFVCIGRCTCRNKVEEMVVNIVLGIRVSPNSFQRVTVRNVSLDSKVEQLKLEASKTVNLSRHFIGNF
jgi:hypothetical protein